jgi:hypothetical protein
MMTNFVIALGSGIGDPGRYTILDDVTTIGSLSDSIFIPMVPTHPFAQGASLSHSLEDRGSDMKKGASPAISSGSSPPRFLLGWIFWLYGH